MLRLSIFCMLLALAVTQKGYEYTKPNRPFGSTSSRPGYPGSSGGTSTPYPLRPQSDDNTGPTTGYPTGPLNYPDSSLRPGFPSSSYQNQDSTGPLRPFGRPSGPDYSGGPSTSSARPGIYPSRPGDSPNDQGSPGGYDSTYPQDSRAPSRDFPGQSDSSYPQGSQRPSDSFTNQGSRYPGQSGSNFGNLGYYDDSGNYEGGDYSAIPGEPYVDYPILSFIPETSFKCEDQQYPGYYADVETRCQVFHICANNITYDFLCPNGTVFSQEHFVCVWWNQFDCNSAPSLYSLNAQLYDYSKTGSSDYSMSGFNDYYPEGRGPQGSSNVGPRPSNKYPSSFRPQGLTTPFTGRYPDVQGPFVSNPSNMGPQGSSGSNPNSLKPSERYPGSQGPSTDSQAPAGSYPSTQGGSRNYPGSQDTTGNYPGAQGPSGNYPGYSGSGSFPSGPGNASSRSPSSTTPYPGTGSGSQGYPSGRPNGPDFPGDTNGKPPPKPNREYLPPRNKRTEQSKE